MFVKKSAQTRVRRSGPRHRVSATALSLWAAPLLYEGVDDIVDQRARVALEEFTFVKPPSGGGIVDCNQTVNRLQLQVDIFCGDVCAGVDEWTKAMPATRRLRPGQAS